MFNLNFKLLYELYTNNNDNFAWGDNPLSKSVKNRYEYTPIITVVLSWIKKGKKASFYLKTILSFLYAKWNVRTYDFDNINFT